MNQSRKRVEDILINLRKKEQGVMAEGFKMGRGRMHPSIPPKPRIRGLQKGHPENRYAKSNIPIQSNGQGYWNPLYSTLLFSPFKPFLKNSVMALTAASSLRFSGGVLPVSPR